MVEINKVRVGIKIVNAGTILSFIWHKPLVIVFECEILMPGVSISSIFS